MGGAMELDVYGVLESNPVLVLFLILGLGLLIGKLRIGPMELGAVTGVLAIGLIAGRIGLDIPQTSHDIGFLLFIYCIGVQAGPQFIRAFREDGAKYAGLALLTAISGGLIAVQAADYFEFELGIAGGMLAGALTSTPTLVAAQDAVQSGIDLPSGMSARTVLDNIASAYAITYVFGMAGLLLLVSFLPRFFRIDVAAEAQALSESRGLDVDATPDALQRPVETPSIRAYRVDQDPGRMPAYDPEATHIPGEIQKIKRGEEVFDPGEQPDIRVGDIIAVVGLQRAHELCRELFGPEVLDPDVLDRSVESRQVVITKPDMAGKTLGELAIGSAHQVWLTNLTRSGIAMPRRPDLLLQMGDVLLISGPRSKIEALAQQLGYVEQELHETDIVTLAFGIALGVFVGMVNFKLGNAVIGLGSAGGVLLLGLLFGLLHSYRPNFGRLPVAARSVLMDLGLLLFMTGVAVAAGRDIVETARQVGPSLALSGMAVTILPALLCFALGHFVMHMNGALLLGAITGSMTSTPALKQITAQARSSVPMLGYVGTYAFANVLLTIAGGVIMRL